MGKGIAIVLPMSIYPLDVPQTTPLSTPLPLPRPLPPSTTKLHLRLQDHLGPSSLLTSQGEPSVGPALSLSLYPCYH